jgi:hypothetical protein
MQFTIYRSTDASAPILSGTAGSLCAVLDAILVNGYGTKVAAGWGLAFTGTNKRIYRAPAGTRFFYQIQDDGPGLGSFKEARLWGYVNATAIDTGTGQFPTVAMAGATAMCIRKSSALDATGRAWICFADQRTVYFFAQSELNTVWRSFSFGEYYSTATVPSTARGLVITLFNENNASPGNDLMDAIQDITTDPTPTSCGMYAPTRWDGSGGARPLQKDVGNGMTSLTYLGSGSICYPNPVDGALHMGPVWVHELGNRIGRMRGFWCVFHLPANFADGQTFTGSGALAGRSFIILKSTPGSGMYCMETSDTLDTN